MSNKYDKMTYEDEARILTEIIREEGVAIMCIPGIYDILREYFNNEILSRWEEENNMD